MQPDRFDHVILGGGAAAAAAAATLRREDDLCSILILSADDLPPYQRPALSKQFLVGKIPKDRILIHPAAFYEENRIELALGAEATALDPTRKIVTTASGRHIRYGRLLIATGAGPRRLDVPGAGLRGVHPLRSIADCMRIRRRIASGAKRAVVLGASFLGMETAVALTELGLEVTVMERCDHVLPHVLSSRVSTYFKRQAEERGATVLLSDTIVAIHGHGRVSEVETLSGRRLPCDLVVETIGVTPSTRFLEGSGLVLDGGLVVVDEQLRTSVDGIFAAGDVTSFLDPVFARRRHVEHWDNALKQGRLAALNMLGRRMRYDEVSYYFCDIGDVSFSMLGAPEEGEEQVARGSLHARSLALFYLKGDMLRAMLSIGRPAEETRSAEGLIRYRVNLSAEKERLNDPDFALDRIRTQTVLVLQGGGAMGAFECGVVKALEESGIYPDVVAGISIGALNGAIVAGNPRRAAEALRSFWSEISVASPRGLDKDAARAITSLQIAAFGIPNFFRPRWLLPPQAPMSLPASWTSYYDATPMKALISRYVDFPKLKSSPVRLLVGAVNVTSGKLAIFDSYVDDLTPEHLLASGSLPPGFPWVEIGGQAYWDGGIVSNSPLDMVIERCGPDGKNIYVVDLFAEGRSLPSNMMEVMLRRDEIVYSERVRNDMHLREQSAAYRELVGSILGQLDSVTQARLRQRPLYIELMGDGAPMRITRFMRRGGDDESPARDYDFSDISIEANLEQGYASAKETLADGTRPGEPAGGASG